METDTQDKKIIEKIREEIENDFKILEDLINVAMNRLDRDSRRDFIHSAFKEKLNKILGKIEEMKQEKGK